MPTSAARPRAKSRNSLTNRDSLVTFSWTMAQPWATRSSSPFSMPVVRPYMPPSRAMSTFFMPCAIPATVSPTAARRSASRFCSSSTLTGVMSVDISMT